MNDFEKLMVLLKVPQDKWESLFDDFCNHNLSLIIDFDKNGSISWGTLQSLAIDNYKQMCYN